MVFRQIVGLHAASTCPRPGHIPTDKPKGSKALGLAYQRAVGRALRRRLGGDPLGEQWFSFADAHGSGFCQTDFLVPVLDELVVVECKLTYVAEARDQLRKLYLPVVAEAFGKPARGVIVCKNLSRNTPLEDLCPDWGAALAHAGPGVPVIHLLPSGRL